MNNRKGNQVIERVLVANGDQDFANVASAGLNRYDLSTKSFRIADGQLGIVYADPNNIGNQNFYTATTDTASTAPFIKLIQGTSISRTSADMDNHYGTQGTDARVVESGIIDLTKAVLYNGTVVKNASYGMVSLGGLTITANKPYRVNVKMSGKELRKFNSEESVDGFSVSMPATDFTALGVTNSTDYVYNALGYEALRNSQYYYDAVSNRGTQPFFVMGLDTNTGSISTDPTFGGVTYTLPTLTSVIAATSGSITVGVVQTGATTFAPIQIPITVELREALTQLVASGINTSSVITILNQSQAGSSASVNKTGLLIFCGLKSAPYKVQDEMILEKLVDIELSADNVKDLNTLDSVATINKLAKVYEGQGQGAYWLIRWKRLAKQSFGNAQVWGSQFDYIVKPDWVDATKNYEVYCIESELDESLFNARNYTDVIKVRTYILVEVQNAYITISGGSPSRQGVVVPVFTAGVLTSYKIIDGGAGYGSTPTLVVVGSTGSSATITATLTSGVITSCTVTGAGSGYNGVTYAKIGSTAAGFGKPRKSMKDYLVPLLNSVVRKIDYTTLYSV